ncbi:MAG TPA: hypothetical protein VEL12_15175 [Candidatus Nitrosopolaris sp.]|nr:hypothetical protein [Candidatus Nitrosopolaris sp.]
MKRVFLSFVMCVGMLVIGVTNASAAYCSLDPTLGIGTPIKTNLKVSTSLLGTSTTVYASTTSSTTTFGGGIGLP